MALSRFVVTARVTDTLAALVAGEPGTGGAAGFGSVETVSPGTGGKYGWPPVTFLPGMVIAADSTAPGYSSCTRPSGQATCGPTCRARTTGAGRR